MSSGKQKLLHFAKFLLRALMGIARNEAIPAIAIATLPFGNDFVERERSANVVPPLFETLRERND